VVAGSIRDRPVALPIGDADLGHRVNRQPDLGAVRNLHHANGKQMAPPARLPDVLPPDLADRDLGGEPQRRHPMLPSRLAALAAGTGVRANGMVAGTHQT
jgi:hypothetical protein